MYDVIRDDITAKSCIHGANYIKCVTNLSDPAFHENCIPIARFLESALRFGHLKYHFLALENRHFWQKCPKPHPKS